jgi:hypothetical protein
MIIFYPINGIDIMVSTDIVDSMAVLYWDCALNFVGDRFLSRLLYKSSFFGQLAFDLFLVG